MRRGIFSSLMMAMLGMAGGIAVASAVPSQSQAPAVQTEAGKQSHQQSAAAMEQKRYARAAYHSTVWPGLRYRHRTPMKHRSPGERAHRNWRRKRRAGRA